MLNYYRVTRMLVLPSRISQVPQRQVTIPCSHCHLALRFLGLLRVLDLDKLLQTYQLHRASLGDLQPHLLLLCLKHHRLVLLHRPLSNSFIHPILQHLVSYHLNLYGDILHNLLVFSRLLSILIRRDLMVDQQLELLL